jgi:polyisoprenoid-binding protein YceI
MDITMSIVNNRTTDLALEQTARENHGTPATHTVYRIDPAASRVEFSIGKRLFFVKHLTITGRFTDINGTITLDEGQPTSAQASVTIGAASIDTQNARRDKHLRTADFFHVDQHPTLTFQSRKVETIDGAPGRYRVAGDLTVRGVTRRVTLDTRYVPAQGTGSGRRIKLTLTAPLNRRDFGIVWNKSIIDVANDLTVKLEVEATAE